MLRNCVHLQGRTVTDLMIRIGRETQEPGIASELILEGLGPTLLGETARLLYGFRSGRAYKPPALPGDGYFAKVLFSSKSSRLPHVLNTCLDKRCHDKY